MYNVKVNDQISFNVSIGLRKGQPGMTWLGIMFYCYYCLISSFTLSCVSLSFLVLSLNIYLISEYSVSSGSAWIKLALVFEKLLTASTEKDPAAGSECCSPSRGCAHRRSSHHSLCGPGARRSAG